MKQGGIEHTYSNPNKNLNDNSNKYEYGLRPLVTGRV